jgi:hypothetical protein
VATVPSQSTVVVGGKITAAYGNDDIRDAINFLLDQPHAFPYQSTGVVIPTGTATETLMTFDAESWDSDVMHDNVTNPSRVIAKTAGLYAVNFQVAFPANATGVRYAILRKNAAGASGAGTALAFARDQSASATGASYVSKSLDVQMAANDYLEVFAIQTSGGNLTSVTGISGTYCQMRRVGA